MYYLYYFILIIIIVVIYGILFRMKNNQVIQTMEEFQNIEDEDVEFNKENIPTLTNKQLITYVNGKWTTNKTEIIGDNLLSDLMTINIEDKKGTLKINKNVYKINKISNGSIYTEKKMGVSYQINFENFKEQSLSQNKPYVIDKNQPRGIVYTLSDNEYIKPYITFKLIDNTLTEQVKNIIQNKLLNPVQQGFLFDKKTYHIITKLYRFPHNALTVSFDDTMILPKKKLNILKNKYNSTYTFQIRHSFEFANNQTVYSKVSQLYNIKMLDDDDNIAGKLIYKPPQNELLLNKLQNKFTKMMTYIYFYRVNSYSGKYKFMKDDLTISKDELKLKNKADMNYSDTLTIPDIKSVSYQRDADFQPILFETFKTTNFEEEKSFNLKILNQYLN